jgi:AraC-like DNA-binding protein
VHLGVSRRLLDLRFRQVCGKSVLEDILDVRLAEVKRMLNDTDRTIIQIGRDCGFNDPDNLKRLFRKRFGTSMREWRAASPVY